MRCRPLILRICQRPLAPRPSPFAQRRMLLTLAIETSCDDTAVAVLEKRDLYTGQAGAILHFHKKITSNNSQYNGVHPLASLHSHQENLANLVDEAIQHLPPNKREDASSEWEDENPEWEDASPEVPSTLGSKRLPDFVSVTRGPGMRSNLFTGLDTAKGLATAWQVDLVGVNHMQAHALTPRLVAALENAGKTAPVYTDLPYELRHRPLANLEPQLPFLSVLASGGHTLIINSTDLIDHEIMGSTADIAVGECLDKIARVVLPSEILQKSTSTMYGALLEDFAFPKPAESSLDVSQNTPQVCKKAGSNMAGYILERNSARAYEDWYGKRYTIVTNEGKAKPAECPWGWKLTRPMTRAAGGVKSKTLEMSFSGLTTAAERAMQFETDPTTGKRTQTERKPEDVTWEERRALARESMRAAFEHIASRVVLSLEQLSTRGPGLTPATLVMSGGVASNSYLRYLLAQVLVKRGYHHMELVFPPVPLCTDNAAMIAWAGIEMYEAGYKDPLSIRAIRKWPLDQLLSPPEH